MTLKLEFLLQRVAAAAPVTRRMHASTNLCWEQGGAGEASLERRWAVSEDEG